ncbi:hypothetical protein F5Y15DRAFT_357147 [Xylariaceae sp. FL0016]|nr:hypothetical protein F5Y15DRAFT_357147 [Xylariaceae sp. FL0016]
MSLPQPPVSLTGSCTVIYNNTLYSYSEAGFESLALEEGAEWKKLSSGVSVEGGVCVGSTPTDSSTAGLFVVGGEASDSEYKGLQKFTYSTGKWESIEPTVNVTEGRRYHSATYINGTDSILMYSGSTDGNPNLSSQTFTITASAPYTVLAFQSTLSPPGVAPILLPWSETQAVMIGGNPTNTKVMLFDAAASEVWSDSGTTLAEPLPKNTTIVKAAIIKADDASKHLYTFDLTTIPNTVNRTVLIDGSGAPVTNSAPLKKSVSNRDLSADQWPQYDGTLAPNATRSDYSVATDSTGLVVMSGGNEDDVLCMFNARENSWQNATAMLTRAEEDSFGITSTPSTSSTAPSAAATSATSTEGAAAKDMSDNGAGIQPTTILGIVLGIIFGIAIILVVFLLLIKRQRRKQNFAEVGHARRASGFDDEKNYFHEDIAPASGFKGHNQQESAGSFSSMAILMGNVKTPALQRKGSNDTKRSSVSSIFNKQFKSTIGRPQPQLQPEPDFLRDNKLTPPPNTLQPKPRAGPHGDQEDSMRRSSGWNRYWSGGSALNILGFGNNGNSRRETDVSEQSGSHYSDMNRMTQDSATVPPLHVDGRPGFHRVNSGSPTVSQYNPRIREGMSAEIERPVSAVSAISSSGYTSGIPPSIPDDWNPTPAKKPWGTDRAPSGAYSEVTVAPSSGYPTALGAPNTSRPPTGVSRQPQLAMASVTSDMSWLNLGDNDPGRNHRY